MIPYYEFLENPNNFKIYLEKDGLDVKRNREILTKITLSFIKNNENLLKKIELLDKIIMIHSEKIFLPISFDYNEIHILYEILFYQDELKQQREECCLDEIKIIKNTHDLIRKLDEYTVYCNYFSELYKENTFFENLKKDIDNAYIELIKIIKIESCQRLATYQVPNGWYFTKNGFLYNPNGEVGSSYKGHKEGNLRHYFDNIKRLFIDNKRLPIAIYNKSETYKEHLNKIIKINFIKGSWHRKIIQFLLTDPLAAKFTYLVAVAAAAVCFTDNRNQRFQASVTE